MTITFALKDLLVTFIDTTVTIVHDLIAELCTYKYALILIDKHVLMMVK